MPTVEDDILDPMFSGRECDEDEGCAVCSNGNHEWCRNDCPLG
jgi:hypothetical protein